MAAIKSFSDLEQSRKLAEILQLETADMHYSRDFGGSWFVDLEAYSSIKLPKYAVNNVEEHLLPCWSLAALLDLMPQRIYDELGCRTFGMGKSWDKCRYQVFYEHKTAYVQKEAETAIDAVFEMIIWLKENKKI